LAGPKFSLLLFDQKAVTIPSLNIRKLTKIAVEYFLYWEVTGAVLMHVLCVVNSIPLRIICFSFPLLAFSLFFDTNLLP